MRLWWEEPQVSTRVGRSSVRTRVGGSSGELGWRSSGETRVGELM